MSIEVDRDGSLQYTVEHGNGQTDIDLPRSMDGPWEANMLHIQYSVL